MIRHVIFDFDGTLADSKKTVIHAYNCIAEKYKFRQILSEDIAHLKTLTITERCHFLKVPVYKLPFLAPEFYRLYNSLLTQVQLMDGVKDLLNNLKCQELKLSIISSNASENIRAFLMNNDIHFIDEICCSNHIFGKDSIIKKFLKRQGLKPSEVIYIGDEQRDIIATKKAGIPIIWVNWGYDAKEMVLKESPQYIANTPEDIYEIIRSH